MRVTLLHGPLMKAVSRAQARARRVGSIHNAPDSNPFGFGLTGAAASRIAWALTHLLVGALVLAAPSSVHAGVDGSGPATPLVLLTLLALATVGTYGWVHGSDPGYVQWTAADESRAKVAGTRGSTPPPPRGRAKASQASAGEAAAVEMVECPAAGSAGSAERAAEIEEETAEVATAIAVGSAEVREGAGRMRAGEEDDVALLDVGLSDSDEEGSGGGGGRRRGRECVYCERWQPLRAKHCHDCGRCVQRFDHHCFWVGTCVGRHNHRRFWWYLTSETALVVWALSINWSTSYVHTSTFEAWPRANAVALVGSLVLGVCTALVGSLWALHTYLALTNQTTWELLRSHHISYLKHVPDHVYPFSQGLRANAKEFCCGDQMDSSPYELPSEEEIRELARRETWWRNRYYSCF